MSKTEKTGYLKQNVRYIRVLFKYRVFFFIWLIRRIKKNSLEFHVLDDCIRLIAWIRPQQKQANQSVCDNPIKNTVSLFHIQATK